MGEGDIMSKRLKEQTSDNKVQFTTRLKTETLEGLDAIAKDYYRRTGHKDMHRAGSWSRAVAIEQLVIERVLFIAYLEEQAKVEAGPE